MVVSDLSIIGWFHSLACLVALAAGAWNLALPKGTAPHRRVGLVYVWAMIALNLSVFVLYKFDIAFAPFRVGPHIFGLFHWFAVTALGLVLIAWFAASRQSHSAGAYAHPIAMVLSYYLLIAGGINEIFLRIDVLRHIALASAKSAHLPPVLFTQSPVIVMTQNAMIAATFLLLIYFSAKVALYRRSQRGGMAGGKS
jgi:uncharacterized membrane protein